MMRLCVGIGGCNSSSQASWTERYDQAIGLSQLPMPDYNISYLPPTPPSSESLLYNMHPLTTLYQVCLRPFYLTQTAVTHIPLLTSLAAGLCDSEMQHMSCEACYEGVHNNRNTFQENNSKNRFGIVCNIVLYITL